MSSSPDLQVTQRQARGAPVAQASPLVHVREAMAPDARQAPGVPARHTHGHHALSRLRFLTAYHILCAPSVSRRSRLFSTGAPASRYGTTETRHQLSEFCRQVAFLRPNEKVPCRTINGLRVSTFLFSVMYDRTLRPAGRRAVTPGAPAGSRRPAGPALYAQSRLARHSNTFTSARAMAARNSSALR